MKKGDIKYVLDIDYRCPTIYEVEIIKHHENWKEDWRIIYIKKFIDFLNSKSLENEVGIYSENHIFSTVEEAIHALVNNEYGMNERKIIKRLFKWGEYGIAILC